MKDILLKCYRYRAESDTLRFPAGCVTVCDNDLFMRSRPDQTPQNIDYTFAWNQKGAKNVFRVG